MKFIKKILCLSIICIAFTSCQMPQTNTFQEIVFDIQYPESVEILAMDKDKAYICYAGDTDKKLTGKERLRHSIHRKNIQYGVYDLKTGTLSNYTNQFEKSMELADYLNGSCLLKDEILYIVGMDEQPVNLSLTPHPQPELSTYIYDFQQKIVTKGHNYGSIGMTTAKLEWLNQDEYLVWMKAWDGYSIQGVYRYNCKDDTIRTVIEFEMEDYAVAESYHDNMIWVYIAKPMNDYKYEHYILGFDIDGNQKQKITLPKEITEFKSEYYPAYYPGYLVALDNNCFYIQHDSSQGSFIIQAEGETSKVIASLVYDNLESVVYSRCNSFDYTENYLYILDEGRRSILRFEPDTLSLKALSLESLNLQEYFFNSSLFVGEDNSLVFKTLPYSDKEEQKPDGKYYYIPSEAFERGSVDIV